MLAVAACGDSSTGPRATAPRALSASAGPAFDVGGREHGDESTESAEFTLTAKGGVFSIKNVYSVNFPANSVCSPRSTYGPGEWDSPCSTLRGKQAIQIHATLSVTSNGVAVNFSPELRFSPSKTVKLSTGIFAAQLQSNPTALFPINFAPSLGSSGVADYLTDTSLVTRAGPDGTEWRRIKHFSGYLIGAGDVCDPLTTTCPT